MGHAGSTDGSGTFGFHFPNRDYVVAAFINVCTTCGPYADLFIDDFFSAVRGILF